MRYRFKSIDFWEEMKAVLGDILVNVTDTGRETLLRFRQCDSHRGTGGGPAQAYRGEASASRQAGEIHREGN